MLGIVAWGISVSWCTGTGGVGDASINWSNGVGIKIKCQRLVGQVVKRGSIGKREMVMVAGSNKESERVGNDK